MTEPYACEPSSLPRYPPCKERDVKLKYEKHKRFGATLCIYCRYFLLFMESFNVWFFFRKSRVNGSVERHRNRQHASQNPGRRVFTPDANNKPQANPKVHMFSPFSSARIWFKPQHHHAQISTTPGNVCINIFTSKAIFLGYIFLTRYGTHQMKIVCQIYIRRKLKHQFTQMGLVV